MYKTVRHGENSLQYTILPQTEEVLNNSGLKGKGRDYSPSIHIRHSRKRSSVKYILLVIFGIIVALALAAIPLYVMNGALYARRSQQGQNEGTASSPRPPTGRDIVKSRKKELKMSPELVSTLLSKLETTTTSSPSTATTTVQTTVTSERATTPRWIMPAMRSWKSSTSSTTIPPIPTEDDEIPLIGTPSGSIRLLDHYMSMKPWEKDVVVSSKPTVAPEAITLRNMFRHYSRSFVPSVRTATDLPKVADVVLVTTKATTARVQATTESTTKSDESRMADLKDALLSADDDDEFKESLEVDEVFSLPPLKPEPAAPADVTIAKADAAWYGARWPFVDTSSYFQWTGYSPGDNLLLPLLVAALSSVALVLLLALAVRKRRRTHAPSASIGLTADLQADDNTNLLTAENPEDAEE